MIIYSAFKHPHFHFAIDTFYYFLILHDGPYCTIFTCILWFHVYVPDILCMYFQIFNNPIVIGIYFQRPIIDRSIKPCPIMYWPITTHCATKSPTNKGPTCVCVCLYAWRAPELCRMAERRTCSCSHVRRGRSLIMDQSNGLIPANCFF